MLFFECHCLTHGAIQFENQPSCQYSDGVNDIHFNPQVLQSQMIYFQWNDLEFNCRIFFKNFVDIRKRKIKIDLYSQAIKIGFAT